MKTIRYMLTVVGTCVAAACGGSPEPTGRGEISRAEVMAEAETAPLSIDTPELRRLAVESAWRFDTDTLEIECWGDSPDQSFYYTGSGPGRPAERTGPSVLGRDVPGARPRRVRLRGGAPGCPAGRPAERSAPRHRAPSLRGRVTSETGFWHGSCSEGVMDDRRPKTGAPRSGNGDPSGSADARTAASTRSACR